jgi:predicted DNA-binding transcriptional regulator AlpA
VTSAQIIAFPRGGSTEPWISKRALAQHYGRSTRWIELRMREGLPSRMLGGRRAFRLSEVEAWMGGQFG